MDARKSQSAVQSRILSYSEAESLKQHEGLRRQSQQRDAEMKIKSIHSRMAALVLLLNILCCVAQTCCA